MECFHIKLWFMFLGQRRLRDLQQPLIVITSDVGIVKINSTIWAGLQIPAD